MIKIKLLEIFHLIINDNFINLDLFMSNFESNIKIALYISH